MNYRANAAGLLLSVSLVGASHAQSAPPVPAPIGRTALYFQFGQSNAVGVTPLTQLPSSVDYSEGPRPIQEVHVSAGSGNSSAYRLRNLNYVRLLSDRVVDSLDGAITGPRGETVVLYNANQMNNALSSFVGVAESVKIGYNLSASKVVLFKSAVGGTLLRSQDPYLPPAEGGGVYRNARRAIVGWMRGFVDAEVKAGRRVDMQMAKLDQGGAEVVQAVRLGVPLSDDGLAWSERLRTKIYPYYVEKFGVAFPILIPQMLPIRSANDPVAPLLPQNEAMNVIEEAACRYTVNVDPDGKVTSLVDRGPSPARLDRGYFLKHNLIGPDLTQVHTNYKLARVLGIAQVNVQRLIEDGNQGLTRYPITRIAPVIMQASAGDVSATRIAVALSVDEIARVWLLAVPAGAQAPSAAALKSSGRIYSVKVDVNGNPFTQQLNVYPLKADTVYDVYAVAADPRFGHTGSVQKVGSNVRTAPAA